MHQRTRRDAPITSPMVPSMTRALSSSTPTPMRTGHPIEAHPPSSVFDDLFEHGRGRADLPHVVRPDLVELGRKVAQRFADLERRVRNHGDWPNARIVVVRSLRKEPVPAVGAGDDPEPVLLSKRPGVALVDRSPEGQTAEIELHRARKPRGAFHRYVRKPRTAGEAEKRRIKDAAVANVKSYLGAKGIRVLAEVLGLSGGALDSFLGSKVEAAVHDLRLTERAVSPAPAPKPAAESEQFAGDLVRDLRDGTLRVNLDGGDRLERALTGILRPEPETALRLEQMFSRDGRFDPTATWPSLRVIELWKGGSTRYYLDLLRERCPNCALRPTVSGSSEAAFLVPLRDDWTGGVPALLSTVFDFVPADSPVNLAESIGVEDLVESEAYRVAVTNSRGLYRYVMDDIFVVEGRYKNTPVLTFSHRAGLVSSLTGEKITEAQVVQALSNSGAHDLSVDDYQLGPEWGDPPRYLLLVELSEVPEKKQLEAFLARFERRLCEANGEYQSKRESFRLSAPALLVVRAGAFDHLRASMARTRSQSDAQLKLPRLHRELITADYVDVMIRVEYEGDE